MRLVIIESPYRATSEWELNRNLAYLRALLLDSVLRGESPMAMHGLLTQVLNDNLKHERAAGIACHVAWARVADAIVVGIDGGVAQGMRDGWEAHKRAGLSVEERSLTGWRRAWNNPAELDAICALDGRNYLAPNWVPAPKAK